MAIQLPNAGLGDGQTGDNEFVMWTKVKDNFSNTTHAANRLVGTAAGNVMAVGAFGFGGSSTSGLALSNVAMEATTEDLQITRMVANNAAAGVGFGIGLAWKSGVRHYSMVGDRFINKLHMTIVSDVNTAPSSPERQASISIGEMLILGLNVTKDANGFLKGASPVIDMYDNKIDLNNDAEKQGRITFEKLGVGDYLVKDSLGFAQEGWYIEMPKDANGNVLVAVVYEQLANNDLSIKTYAKRFDDETGDIVANLTKPRDIPTGRFISLRLHELPQEPPVMPAEIQTEV